MSLLRLSFLLITIVIISACATKPAVTNDYDIAYDFSQLSRYAWVEATDPDTVETLDHKRQKNAIEQSLNQKGFSKADNKKNANFLLKIHTITDKKTSVDRFYQTWGYHRFYHPHLLTWPHNTSTIVREYKIGTLVLDIVDPTKKQVIWRGSISKPLGIYKNRTPEERMSIALTNAQQLLASFPPSI